MKGWRLDLGLLGVLGLAALLLYLQLHPLEQVRPELGVPPSLPGAGLDEEPGPFVLLVDASVVDRQATGPLPGRDWSFAWINWFEQELGLLTVLEPGRLSDPAQLPQGVRVLVVSRSAWPGLDATGRLLLESVVASGGVVVAETPPAEAILPADPLGVVLLDQSFAAQLVRLQQGWSLPAPRRPEQRSRPAERQGPGPLPELPPERLFTADLAAVMTPEVLSPAADHLERELLSRIEALTPLARWWPFPEGAAGVACATYEEAGFGNAAGWMTRYDRQRNLPGTLFVSGLRLTPAQLPLLAAPDTLGLSWVRGLDGENWRVPCGLGPIQPCWRAATLQEQRAALLPRPATAEGPAGLARSLGGVWDRDFARSFRILEQAGFSADSSYGPSDADRFGYLFGTGLPFHPLDGSGRPFRLYEIPYLFRNDGRYDRARQDALLRGSRQGDHQLVVGLLRTDFMARSPGEEPMEAWLGLPEAARRHEHLLLPLDRYLGHYTRRLRSPLRQQWDEERGLLTCQAEATEDGQTLALSARTRGVGAIRLELDGTVLPPESWLRRGNTLLLPLTAGRHEIQVQYPQPLP
ncbi:MAG: hypothetical protein RBU45_02265 [Myxococcota bacterium]|jgi:hypothetical protein|nr:hypothetical protein [Myxococcota bacterium]